MADAVDEAAEKVAELSVNRIAVDALSKNALKRELKKKQKEDEKRLKDEEKKKKAAAAQNSQSHKDSAVEDDDMDPSQYFENRHKYLASQKVSGLNPYPHKFQVSISVEDYIQKYASLNQGEHLNEEKVNLAGRIMNKRTSSSKLYFYDLYGMGVKVQVMADARDSDLDEVEFSRLHVGVKRGDIVGICGYPGKSKRGELSVFPNTFVVLSHCLHMMPRQKAVPGDDKTAIKKHEGTLGSKWVPGFPRNPETYVLKDQLVGHFLEETCVNPSFIINHPEIMSPLAKWHRSKPGLTERFELFINKHEVCNAYTELNDPVVQRDRFAEQLKSRHSGDDEAMALDETFCTALEYGLPPTGGWGLGVDRLTMILTDSQNIKEVILFPAMKPQDEPSSSKA